MGLGRQQTNMQEYQTTGGICAVLAAGMGKNVGSLAGQAFEARGGEDSSDHLPAVDSTNDEPTVFATAVALSVVLVPATHSLILSERPRREFQHFQPS